MKWEPAAFAFMHVIGHWAGDFSCVVKTLFECSPTLLGLNGSRSAVHFVLLDLKAWNQNSRHFNSNVIDRILGWCLCLFHCICQIYVSVFVFLLVRTLINQAVTRRNNSSAMIWWQTPTHLEDTQDKEDSSQSTLSLLYCSCHHVNACTYLCTHCCVSVCVGWLNDWWQPIELPVQGVQGDALYEYSPWLRHWPRV